MNFSKSCNCKHIKFLLLIFVFSILIIKSDIVLIAGPSISAPDVVPAPTKITSSVFSVSETNSYISKIGIGTTIQTLKSGLNEKTYVTVFNKDHNVVSNDSILATGMTAELMNNNVVTKKYTVIVTGDTNGDGKINITDMIAVKACSLKKSGLSGAYEKAGDVNGDGKINITDFIKVKATTLKKDSITGVSVN